jgi:hypothetical protein
MTPRMQIVGRHWQALFLATALAMPGLAEARDGVAAQAGRAAEDHLLTGFREPPPEARPRVWWHWMNGNITQDGILRDLAWMKDIGIGGAQAFDAAMQSPQIVAERLTYMSPSWQDAMRTAAREADRLGLELAIASSPGFTETGGPWVAPEDGIKKLVWSETDLVGGRDATPRLAQPPSLTGPFQTIPADPSGGLTLTGSGHKVPIAAPLYRDIAVLAWPLEAQPAVPLPTYADGDGNPLGAAALTDDDLASAIDLARPAQGDPVLLASFDRPRTIRSARLFLPASSGRYSGGALEPVLEKSDDGAIWRFIGKFAASAVPATISFAPVTASRFRVIFRRAASSPVAGFVPPVAGLDMAALSRMLGSGGAAMMGASSLKVGDFQLYRDARVDRAETRAGFDIALDYFALPENAPDDPGVPLSRIIDLTDKLRADGALDWSPPKGRWRVLRLGWSLTGVVNHPASPEATGLEVDKFDGAAVRRYLDHYLGLFRQAVGPDLIGARGIRALLNDSIESGPANWTPQLRARFVALRGYDPLPWMPALTGTIVGSRGQSDRFLFDYRRTLSDLIASEHYGTIARFAREQGLSTYGEAQEHGRAQLGDDLAMRRHADIPMAALWTYPRERGPQLNYLVDMRGAASVANIYGKQFVAAEMMTSLLSPWAFGPLDLKRVADLAFVSGINRPVIHTSAHVPTEDRKPGLSLFIFGQYFNRNESWATLARPWVEYLSRNAFLLQQGRRVTDLAYFYGEEAPLTGLYSDRAVPDAPKAHGYDFINVDALMGALANDGADLVTPGGARYRALYLGGSSRRMTLATLCRVHALVSGGATVIGQRPEADPGLIGDSAEYARLAGDLWAGSDQTVLGKGRVIASSDPEAALARMGVVPDFRVAGPDIAFLHRQLADGELYFVSNRTGGAQKFEARFRVTGKAPELWNAVTGEVTPASFRIEGSETVVPLDLPGDGSVHVVFRRSTALTAFTTILPEPVEAARLDGAWNVAFEAGRGAPASVRLAELAPLDQHADPAIRHFSGIATYTREFRVPRGWRPGQALWLDLGEAREIAEISLNGSRVGGLWNAPYRLDIGPIAKRGQNRLSVKVANLWVNRMIGDAQPGAQKVTWTASPTYTANAPLLRSGLIGPVRLLREPAAGTR